MFVMCSEQNWHMEDAIRVAVNIIIISIHPFHTTS